MSKEALLSEKTKITLGTAVAVGMFVGILLIWAIRAESALNTKVDKLNYVEDITELKGDVKQIKKALNISD